MFPLVETIIAFSAIMLVLSFLVKSLTSVIKNHFDFYSRNLRQEVYSLLEGTLEISRKELQQKIEAKPTLRTQFPWLAKDWKRLGEEYLTKENITWVLKKLDPQKATEDVIKDLEGRLAVHVSNVRYMFEKRLKNVTLAVGLALCLGLNINAFAIWDKLYNDQDVRAKFSSTKFVSSAVGRADNIEKKIKEIEKDKDKEKEKDELKKQRDAVVKQIRHFHGQVGFGIGKIWTETPSDGIAAWKFLFVEFFGALLTGILVSIGAPYWHDLLRALAKLRKGKSETKP
jgi:hypothetical protein